MDNRQVLIQNAEDNSLAPDFWDDPKSAEGILKQLKENRYWVSVYNTAEQPTDDLEVLFDFAQMGEATNDELDQQYEVAKDAIEELELLSTLNKPEDQLVAVMTINAGAGGTESSDWASMLMRMYIMWGEKNGYKVSELDIQPDEVRV